MSKEQRIVLQIACVATSFCQGWLLLKWRGAPIWLLFFGLPGGIPFFFLNGAHGDTEGISGIVGGILYVLTNGAVYYWIATMVLKRWKRHKEPLNTIVIPRE